jgi:alpha-galactosidase
MDSAARAGRITGSRIRREGELMAGLAVTPPMGWNSWDCFGTTVTEAEVLANAQVLADRLLPAGWDTVVVDIDWYDPTARAHGYTPGAPLVLDGHGRPLPDPVRFPSAAGGRGFGPLAEAVHGLGLRFGLHLLRGIPRLAVQRALPVLGTDWSALDAADQASTCAWNPDNYGLAHDHPAAAAYLDSLVALLGDWQVDYLKLDDVLAPYAAREIEAWSQALGRGTREIVLSLSPGTRLSTAHLDHLRRHAQLWRISDDLWDRWADVHAQFARLARWAPLQQPGGWADADMLPLGRIGLRAERGEPRDSRLSPDEQHTLLTLWAMARSPLMIGGDQPSSSEATLARLGNPALGRALRESREGRELLREPDGDGELIVWTAQQGPDRLVALFWTGPAARTVSLPLGDAVGHGEKLAWTARDLWHAGGAEPLSGNEIRVEIAAHGVVWLALAPTGHPNRRQEHTA